MSPSSPTFESLFIPSYGLIAQLANFFKGHLAFMDFNVKYVYGSTWCKPETSLEATDSIFFWFCSTFTINWSSCPAVRDMRPWFIRLPYVYNLFMIFICYSKIVWTFTIFSYSIMYRGHNLRFSGHFLNRFFLRFCAICFIAILPDGC